MRTTVTLDDDVALRLQAESRRTGKPFKTVINEHLRTALAQRRIFKVAPPFRVAAEDLGGPLPGRTYDDIGALLESAEGAGA